MESQLDRKRSKRAFRVANKIMFRYLWLWITKRLRSKENYTRSIQQKHQQSAEDLRELILELKGLFIKVGQLISVLSTALPKEFITLLEGLQDHAPAMPFEETQGTITSELGESVATIFSEFSKEPIASASIGQVHKARLKSGEQVAVKVQHPDIEELAACDLEIIHRLIKRISFFFRIKGLEHVYEQVKLMISEELDYDYERNSMERIRENLEGYEGVIVPKTYAAYSSKKILVSDFQEGVKVTNLVQLEEWGIDPEALSVRIIELFCVMILEHGFYHADPHPGNLMINANGDIILIDFGATATLNEEMRNEIPLFVQYIVQKDTRSILQSLQKMGFVGRTEDAEEVAEKLIEAVSHFLQNEINIQSLNPSEISIDDIKGSSVDKLRKEIGIREMGRVLQIPKDWILLERAIILIFGISTTLAPEKNPIDTLKPYFRKLLFKNGGVRRIIVDAIKKQFFSILQLPSELSTFLRKANKGELPSGGGINEKTLYTLAHQFFLVFTLLVLALFLVIAPWRKVDWVPYIMIPIGVLLFISLIKNRK